ncbi:gamma-glutamylcyclotransferase [Burkholderia sp. Ax-1719]|nr:gamma-glutamylcyclotransferase [Burkholderia sp. Ax-1719]
MLSRESILSGAYLKSFENIPGYTPWTPARIQDSIAHTLAQRPWEKHIWMFAYGSLIWNPLVNVDCVEVGTLCNWHRSFCLRIDAGRASLDAPGRMLGLEAGGSTDGLALRLDAANLSEDLIVIWTREMVLGSYKPTWAPVKLRNGETVFAIVFVVDPNNMQYEINSTPDCVAPLIARAEGPMGTNRDYVRLLEDALINNGLVDDYVSDITAKIAGSVSNDSGLSEPA